MASDVRTLQHWKIGASPFFKPARRPDDLDRDEYLQGAMFANKLTKWRLDFASKVSKWSDELKKPFNVAFGSYPDNAIAIETEKVCLIAVGIEAYSDSFCYGFAKATPYRTAIRKPFHGSSTEDYLSWPLVLISEKGYPLKIRVMQATLVGVTAGFRGGWG